MLAPSAYIMVPNPVTHLQSHPEARVPPGCDSNGRYLPRSTHEEGTSNRNCYNYGRSGHFVKECLCPACAKGYTTRIDESDGESPPVVPETTEEEPPPSDVKNQSPQAEPDNVSNHDDGHAGATGDQYTTLGDNDRYPFLSDEGSQIIPQVVRVIPSVQEDLIGAHAAKASKAEVFKPKAVGCNCAHYKIGAGEQPSHNSQLQRCIEVLVPVNGLKACVLLDGGSITNMLSPVFTTVVKIPAIELQEQTTLQLATTGSRSMINYGAWADIEIGPIAPHMYFYIANIDGYDAIWGTPFMWEHRVLSIFKGDGWIMKDKHRLDLECTKVKKTAHHQSCQPQGHPIAQ